MSDMALVIERAIEALESPSQKAAALHHMIQGDLGSALLVIAAPSQIYAQYDHLLRIAYLAGMASQLEG